MSMRGQASASQPQKARRTDLTAVLQQGTAHAWLYIPTAILLGGLHGLEPGHSKTMMAAFIIAIRGTIAQAVLLGLSAAISHSLLIWLLAAAALKYGSHWNAESSEPYFQIASAVIIAGLAFWMFWRTRRDLHAAAAHEHHGHGHGHTHDHGHSHSYDHQHEDGHGHDETRVIDTGYAVATLSIFETGVPPVFRLAFAEGGTGLAPEASEVTVETVRNSGE